MSKIVLTIFHIVRFNVFSGYVLSGRYKHIKVKSFAPLSGRIQLTCYHKWNYFFPRTIVLLWENSKGKL